MDLNIGPEIFVALKEGGVGKHYKIGKTLGEGAYGKVYLVTHRTTNLVRAMKSLKKSAVTKDDESQLFFEVSILKDLDHPNIARLYELYQDENNYYLISEFCSGGELFDKICNTTFFSEKIAADYIRQILSAIIYCHEKKIVHRDLKPENLLLSSPDKDATLKVIDFGTSRRFQAGEKMHEKLGTPYYVAPEVLDKNYDEKCDVWSCGIILYILMCGYPPFNGNNDAQIIKAVQSGKFTFPAEEWGEVSEDCKTLIKKMLNVDPTKRITAKEALNDIWVQNNSQTAKINTGCLKNLASFSSSSKLREAILALIATQMTTESEKKELSETFKALDRDGNGVLSREELIEGYVKVFKDKAAAEAEALRIIESVDINNSGHIDFTEFIIAASNAEKLLSKDKLEQAFKIFDIDNDGFITRSELASVMGGVHLDDDQWKKLVSDVDENDDGQISKEEFVDLLTKLK
jgi:calcium-dependent protein kinase